MRTVRCACGHIHRNSVTGMIDIEASCWGCKCVQFVEDPLDAIIVTENGGRKFFKRLITGEIEEIK